MLVYLAGPYRACPEHTIEQHIETARKAAIGLWERGVYVLCPHLNTAGFEKACSGVPDDVFIKAGIDMLRRCDAVVLLPEWFSSEGARRELSAAWHVGLPVHYYKDPGRP